jgi:hypothetical protein
MPKAKFVVYTRPKSPEREDEYNKWYDETHIPQLRMLPGFTGARRYKRSRTTTGPEGVDSSLPEYMAIYDLEADDLQAVFDGLSRAVAGGTIHIADVVQTDPLPRAGVYEELET